MYSIVPSLPAKSTDELFHLLDELKGVSAGFQVDMVDGQFVPLISWPFTESDIFSELAKLRPYSEQYELEIDCMILNPEQYLDEFVSIGIKRVIVHFGSTNKYHEISDHAKKYGYALGIAGTNDVPVADLLSAFETVDFVQVMGIAHVGEQGQPFDERTIDTVRQIRREYPELEIAVDGSVNAVTIPRLKKAGVNRFAPGSAIAKQASPVDAYHHLQSLVM